MKSLTWQMRYKYQRNSAGSGCGMASYSGLHCAAPHYPRLLNSQLGWWDLLLSIFRECRCTWPGSVRLGQSIWQRARQIEENNSCLLGSSFNTATPGVLRRGWASLSGSNKASNWRIVARLINYLDWNLIKWVTDPFVEVQSYANIELLQHSNSSNVKDLKYAQ